MERRGLVFVGILDFALLDVRLQAFVEVVCAEACGDDGGDQQEDGDDGEDCKSFPCRKILGNFAHVAGVVHANEFEDEVGHGGEVDDDHDRLADVGFTASDERGEDEETHCDRDGDNGEVELEVGEIGTDDDEELDRESKEKEEIELEKGDVNLSDVSEMK